MSNTQATQPWSLRHAIEPGRRAVLAHYKPILLIQFVLISVVVGYYASPQIRELSNTLVALREQGGIPMAAVLTGFGSTILPLVALYFADRSNFKKPKLGDFVFDFLFFALIGTMSVILFNVLTMMYGDKQDAGTVALKVATDMFLFSPFCFMPVSSTLQQWRLDRFKIKQTISRIGFLFFRDRGLPLVLLMWSYWLPVGLCSYSLPLPLQFWVYLFAQAAYSFLFLHVSRGK